MIRTIDPSRHPDLHEALTSWHRGELAHFRHQPLDLGQLPGQPTCATLIDASSESPLNYINVNTACIIPFYDCWDSRNRRLAEYPDQKYHEAALYPQYSQAVQRNQPEAEHIRARICDKMVQYQRVILPDAATRSLLVLFWVDFIVKIPPSESLRLTSRERECLLLMAAGYNAKNIAHRLNIACRTAEHHIASIKRKLNAKNSVHAISIALSNSLIPDIA